MKASHVEVIVSSWLDGNQEPEVLEYFLDVEAFGPSSEEYDITPDASMVYLAPHDENNAYLLKDYNIGQDITVSLPWMENENGNDGQGVDQMYQVGVLVTDAAGNMTEPLILPVILDHRTPEFDVRVNCRSAENGGACQSDGFELNFSDENVEIPPMIFQDPFVQIEVRSDDTDYRYIEISDTNTFANSGWFDVNYEEDSEVWYETWWYVANPQASGQKTIYLRATDKAGNIRTHEFTFELDLSDPSLRLDIEQEQVNGQWTDKVYYNTDTVQAFLILLDENVHLGDGNYRYAYGVNDVHCEGESQTQELQMHHVELNFDLANEAFENHHNYLIACIKEPSGRTSYVVKEIYYDTNPPEIFWAACDDCNGYWLTDDEGNEDLWFFTRHEEEKVRLAYDGWDHESGIDTIKVRAVHEIHEFEPDDAYDGIYPGLTYMDQHAYRFDLTPGKILRVSALGLNRSLTGDIIIYSSNNEEVYHDTGFHVDQEQTWSSDIFVEEHFEELELRIHTPDAGGYLYYNIEVQEFDLVPTGDFLVETGTMVDDPSLEENGRVSMFFDVDENAAFMNLQLTPTGDDMEAEAVFLFPNDHGDHHWGHHPASNNETMERLGGVPLAFDEEAQEDIHPESLEIILVRHFHDMGEGEGVNTNADYEVVVEWLAQAQSGTPLTPIEAYTESTRDLYHSELYQYVQGQDAVFRLKKTYGSDGDPQNLYLDDPYDVQISFIDKAGNESEVVTLKIVLDRVAPTLDVIPVSALITEDAYVEFDVDTQNDPYVDTIRVSNSNNVTSAFTFPVGETIGWELSNAASDGHKSVYVFAYDFAGNLGQYMSLDTGSDFISFELDGTPPVGELSFYPVLSKEMKHTGEHLAATTIMGGAFEGVMWTPNDQFVLRPTGAPMLLRVKYPGDDHWACELEVADGEVGNCLLGGGNDFEYQVFNLSSSDAVFDLDLRLLGAPNTQAAFSNATDFVTALVEVTDDDNAYEGYSFGLGINSLECHWKWDGEEGEETREPVTWEYTAFDYDVSTLGEGTYVARVCLREASGLQTSLELPLTIDRTKPHAWSVACDSCNDHAGIYYTNNPENRIDISHLVHDEMSPVAAVKVASQYQSEAAYMTNSVPDGSSYVIPGESVPESFSVQAGELSILTLTADGNETMELMSFYSTEILGDNGVYDNGERGCHTQIDGFKSRCSVYLLGVPDGVSQLDTYVNSYGTVGMSYQIEQRTGAYTALPFAFTDQSIAVSTLNEVKTILLAEDESATGDAIITSLGADIVKITVSPNSDDVDLYVRFDNDSSYVCESRNINDEVDACHVVPPVGTQKIHIFVESYESGDGAETVAYDLSIDTYTLTAETGSAETESVSTFLVEQQFFTYENDELINMQLSNIYGEGEWYGHGMTDDGIYDLAVSFFDQAGNESDPLPLRVRVDREQPYISAYSINGGDENTGDALVNLDFSVVDRSPIKEVRISDTPAFSSVTHLFKPSREHTLPSAGGDGHRDVFVEVKDAAGNTAQAADSIFFRVDRLPAPYLKSAESHDLGDSISWTVEWYPVPNVIGIDLFIVPLYNPDEEGGCWNTHTYVNAEFVDFTFAEVEFAYGAETDCPYVVKIAGIDEWGIIGEELETLVVIPGN